MARTSITVTQLATHQDETSVAKTTGDPAPNNMQVDGAYSPRLHLFVFNSGANTITYDVKAAPGDVGYASARAITNTITAFAYQVIPLDYHPDLLYSGQVHIDSSDANFSDLIFSAYTWQDTPVRF